MKKIPSIVITALAIVAALVLVRECGYRDGARTALAKQRDVRDDSTVSRLIFESRTAETRFQRERDSTGRVIRGLQAKIAPRDSIHVTDTVTVYQQLAGRDSLITALDEQHRQDSLQTIFWRAQIIAYRDTVVPELVSARNAWRRRAERPSYTITDIGGGLVTGWAIAKDNGEGLKLGLALLVLPRAIRAIGSIF